MQCDYPKCAARAVLVFRAREEGILNEACCPKHAQALARAVDERGLEAWDALHVQTAPDVGEGWGVANLCEYDAKSGAVRSVTSYVLRDKDEPAFRAACARRIMEAGLRMTTDRDDMVPDAVQSLTPPRRAAVEAARLRNRPS